MNDGGASERLDDYEDDLGEDDFTLEHDYNPFPEAYSNQDIRQNGYHSF